MHMRVYKFLCKALSMCLVFCMLLLSGQAFAANLNITQIPLFLTEGVAPNIMVTIDNSGSMRWAYSPDDLNPVTNATYGGYTSNEIRTSRRAKSAAFNGIYYNPEVTYTAPYDVTYNGGSMDYTPLTTSFTGAYINGFKSSAGSYDLSSSYRVSWLYNTSSTTSTSNITSYTAYTNYGYLVYWLAANPSSDYGSTSSSSSVTGASTTTSNYTYSTSSNSCPSSISSSSSNSTTTSTSTDADTGATVTTAVKVTTVTSYSGISCSSKNGKYTVTVTKTTTPTTTTTVSRSDKTTSGVPAYYYVYDSSLSGCDGTIHDDDCYSRVVVSSSSGVDGSDERQNFANWYSFYRNRGLATQSAANLAFSSLSDSVRLNWQGLGDATGTCITSSSYLSSYKCSGITTTYDNRLDDFANSHRETFFSWLGDISYDQSTPLREAVDRLGEYLTTTGKYSPYAYSPGSTEEPLYACRASYSITLTDGVWNGSSSYSEYDNASQTLPDGQSYSPRSPYADSQGGTLADLAFKYWAADAQTAIDDEVPVQTEESSTNATTQYWNPKNNPATWQHMVSYFVGLGLSNSLTDPEWGGDTYSGDYSSLLSGSKSWPAASATSSNNVYDLWHAAINSRGEFFSVDSPSDLVTALQDVVNSISEKTATAASPAVTSPLLDSDGSNSYDTYTYTSQFSSEDWSGDLIKYEQDTTAGTQTEVWSAQDILDSAYSTGNSAYSSRVIKISDTSGDLQNFTWTNLTTAQKTSLNKSLDGSVDSYGSDRVNYLRGDRSNEGVLFRERNHILGDIIDSSAVIVRNPSRLASSMNGTESQSSADSDSYTKFKLAQASRETRIYVGANDGMLHAFNEDGDEEFAFIPSEVVSNLYKLTDEDYDSSSHQYYVDGSLTEADVYFSGSWHSVLIGSLRGGGRSLFALDITDPDAISLLWEISAGDAGYEQLGFTYAKPVVTKLSNGDWAVVTGNGYNSDDDAAVLYLIDVTDGSLIKSFTVDDGSSTNNGLATPYIADLDGDLIAEYAYAGDLQGNLWRFDLQGSNTSAYDISFSGSPLYTAVYSGTAQPITSRPYLVKHSSGVGYIVIFGTGKYLESSDAEANTSDAMTLYGIWDATASVGSTGGSTPTLSRSNLVAQTMTAVTATYDNNGTTVTVDGRTVSENEVDWFNTDGSIDQYGWYLDLKETGNSLEGEMVVSNPYVTDDLLVFSTLIPDSDPCAGGVSTWLMTLDPYTGGSTSYSTVDLNNDGVVDEQDSYLGSVISGLNMPGLTGGFTSSRDASGNIVVCGSESCETLSGDVSTSGRQSWRKVQTKD